MTLKNSKLVTIFSALLFIYFMCRALYPQVSILNSSGIDAIEVTIWIQNGQLDFNYMRDDETKDFYYSLFSGSGKYHYLIKLKNGVMLEGDCGSFEALEFSKAVIFLISDDKLIYSNPSDEPIICELF
ncbi:hypothetical protein [Glaciecola sp. 1036]|uniref:hypothetical protein n=1 Tax=Alteromonadaceae TaxID=72275 RepID=UPI003D043AD9